MRSVVQILLVLAIGGTGCKRPPEAPQELDDLSRYLYREWDNEDEAVVAVGLENLKAFLREVDLSKSVMDRSWELEPVKPRDVDDVDHPKRDPTRTLGVAVAYRSTWPIDDHARLQIEPDQLIAEPSAALYDRRFPGVSDPDCFLSQSCNPLSTENDVERQNLLMSVSGVLFKEFRWVTLDTGALAFYSRSWIAESWIGEKENSTIWQSFSIDVWLPDGKNEVLRYQTLWSESDVANASDAITIGTIKSSTDNIFDAGDEAIEELYH